MSSSVPIYNRNLVSDEFEWDRVYGPPSKPGSNGWISKGPWKIDTNHAEYGLLIGPAVLWCDGRTTGLPDMPNLLDATIEVEVEFEDKNHVDSPPLETIGVQLVFWFQTRLQSEFGTNPPRYANYIWNTNLLPEARSTGKRQVLPLSSLLADWTCLGRQRRDVKGENTKDYVGSASKYSCALRQTEFVEALQAVTQDLGLLLVLDWKKWLSIDNGAWMKKSGAWSATWDDMTPQRDVLNDSLLVLRHFAIVK